MEPGGGQLEVVEGGVTPLLRRAPRAGKQVAGLGPRPLFFEGWDPSKTRGHPVRLFRGRARNVCGVLGIGAPALRSAPLGFAGVAGWCRAASGRRRTAAACFAALCAPAPRPSLALSAPRLRPLIGGAVPPGGRRCGAAPAVGGGLGSPPGLRPPPALCLRCGSPSLRCGLPAVALAVLRLALALRPGPGSPLGARRPGPVLGGYSPPGPSRGRRCGRCAALPSSSRPGALGGPLARPLRPRPQGVKV